MKKVTQILTAIIAVVILANCGGKQGPDSVAENFLNHLAKKEFAEAKALSNEATQNLVGIYESSVAGEIFEGMKIAEVKCTEEAEKATCTYKDGDKDMTIVLAKVDGDWKVAEIFELPEVMCVNYLVSLRKGDYETAKSFGTEDTKSMIDFLGEVSEEDKAKDVKIEGMKCEFDGDNATCNYKENGEDGVLNLVKQDGAWKVHQPKELNFDEDGEGEEEGDDIIEL